MLKEQLYMTKEQFENLQINDYVYYYSSNSNIIMKNKITAKYNNSYDSTISYTIKNDCAEYEINFISIVFLTEKECLQYWVKDGYRKELREKYGKKYVEYFI